MKENSYSGGLNLKGSVGVTGVSVGASINVNNINTKKDSKVHEESNVSLRGNSKIEENLDATNINLTYDNLVVNANKVNFRAIKDEENVVENTTGINLGINISASSPIVKDALNIGKGVKNLLEGRIDKAISNISNGYVGAVDDLSGNIKVKKENKYVRATKEDLNNIGKDKKLEKDISAYVNVSGGVNLNVSNKTTLLHNEKVRGNVLSGGNILFNKNKEVNYTSTIVKDSNVLYNSVESVRKDVLRAENKKEIIDASVSLGVSAGLDTMEMKVSPGSINVGAKVSYELQESKENALNILENTKEVYNNVDNVSIRGLKTKDSTIEGSIKNLNVEEVKDEKTRNKVGLGFDVSIAFTGTPTGGNGELEFVDKREEKVHKRDIDLSKLEIERLTLKEEKENNHNIDYGLKVGTSGVSARVGEYGLDLNLNVLDAIVNPNEFKDKQELALKDLESSYKGIRSSIENISKTTSDEETDIADEERRSLRELSNYHLNGEYIVRSLNEKSANTKEDRLSLVRDVDFKDLKVFDKITEENVELLPEDLKRRYYEARERGEELRVIVDQEKNVYTFGDMSELEFKKGLARELGIHLEGRKTEDGKLLGVAAGNIYSDYVLNGSEEITNLEKDNLLDIPRDAKVVSDKLINSSMLSNHYLEIINERNNKKLEVYTKTEEFQLLKKVGLVTLHTVSIVGDVAVMVGTGGISIPVGAITILDSVDEIDRIIRGCEGDDCKTTLNKIVGDKSYYFVKGTATVIGVVQTAKLAKNVVKSLSKTDDAIKTLDKLDDGLKIVSKSDDTLNSISKTEKSIKVIDRTKPSNIGDILSVTKSDDVIIPKNRIKGSVVTEKGYKVSYDTKKFGTQIDDIIRNGDSTGKKTEKIINDIFKSTPDLEVLDGKYGSNNGIDHLVYNKKTKELWVIDSKQISNLKNYESGSMTLLESAAKDTRQLSEDWIKAVGNKLPKKEKELLENNIDNIRTAVMGINKKTGEIIFVPLKVENKIK